MVIRLLGVTRVEVNGRPVPLPPLPCALLARLALTPRGVITTESLIDGLWGATPPASARTRVHALISSLRRTFADIGLVDVIVSRPPGYLLGRDAVVDVIRFEEHCAQARHALADRRPDVAVRALTDALALWSGEALGGLSCPFAEAARVDLEERRFRTVEDKIRLDLDRRPPEDLVVELTRLVAAYPLRERLRGHLMTSLSRAGRQTDALEAYRSYVRVLDEGYGLRPGAELSALNSAILRSSAGHPVRPSASAAVGEERPPAPPRTPALLPPDVPAFCGRVTELRRLDSLLAASSTATAIAVVSGTAGVGKTALALHWAHRTADRFPDGQLYIDLRGFGPTGSPVRPRDALRRLVYALGVAVREVPSDLADLTSLYRSSVAGRRVLVVLDNARDAEQARPLLPGFAECAAIVTSRDTLAGLVALEGAQPLQLPALGPGESRQLLIERLRAARMPAEPYATENVIGPCAGLPLALVIVAARATTHAQPERADAAREPTAGSRALDAWRAGDARTDLREVFSWSYQVLEDHTARLFRLLAVHPAGQLTVPAVARLAGVTPAAARRGLDALVRVSLLHADAPGRYSQHQLLRMYARELAEHHDSAACRRSALHRLLHHFLQTAQHAAPEPLGAVPGR